MPPQHKFPPAARECVRPAPHSLVHCLVWWLLEYFDVKWGCHENKSCRKPPNASHSALMRPFGDEERCASVTAHADLSARSLDHPHWGGESRPQIGRSPEVDPALQVLSHADGNPNVATALKPKWTGAPLRDSPTQQPPLPHSPDIPPARNRAVVALPSDTRLEVVANMDRPMPKSHDNSCPTCDLQIIILSLENIRVANLCKLWSITVDITQPRFLSPLSSKIFKYVVLMRWSV